ncbi:MAG TPA: cobalamin-binding protein [Roseimicrobium sp.]|nr:cobalamin-binding protein [Roseimicrobium sp.]
MKAPRVVSLLPSATEILCALGQKELLVGRSHECDFPADIRDLPVCTAATIDVAAPSAAIDRSVKERCVQALSLYTVDKDLLRKLQPDIILTQAQCEVCAVSEADVTRALADWIGKAPRVLSLSPKKLADLWTDMRTVAVAVGLTDEGKAQIKALKHRCVDVIEKACGNLSQPRVLCIEWLEPLMSAGNWVPELVELAGGVNLSGEAGKHSPWLEWDAIRELDPEIIVVMPCGFDIQRTRSEIDLLTGRPGWAALKAVKEGNVFVVDGNQYFNRPGPRLIDSLEILAEIFSPQIFPPRFEGGGWQRL